MIITFNLVIVLFVIYLIKEYKPNNYKIILILLIFNILFQYSIENLKFNNY